MQTVNIIAVERQEQCTSVVVSIRYAESPFEIRLQLRPEAEQLGGLAEACRSELLKLVDGLLQWEVSDGSVGELAAARPDDNASAV
jgi:hypothetical protein